MIIECANCTTRFKVPDDRVTEKGTKVRCSKCTHVFVVYPQSGVSSSAESGAASGPAGKKKTLQFRAGSLDDATGGADEKLKRRVTETFDVPAPKANRVSPFQTAGPLSSPGETSSGPAPSGPASSGVDPFSSAALPRTAADPYSQASQPPTPAAPSFASMDPFGPPSSTPPAPAVDAPASPGFGADPFSAKATPDPFSRPGMGRDPFSAPPSSPPAPAPSAKPGTDPFGGADPFGTADPFGGAPDPFASASAASSSPAASSPPSPFGPPNVSAAPVLAPKSADPFAALPKSPAVGADPFGGRPTSDPFGMAPPKNDLFGSPGSSPFGGSPFDAPAPGPAGRAQDSLGPESALNGLFDDVPSSPRPPPMPLSAKPVTDPFDSGAFVAALHSDDGPLPGFDGPEFDGDLETGANADAFDGGATEDGSPPRQNFQAETRIYSVPHELREASVPGIEVPAMPTTSMPVGPSPWSIRLRMVGALAWQVVVLATFVFAAVIWARGGTLDDVLDGKALAVISSGGSLVPEDVQIGVKDVRVQMRSTRATTNQDPSNLVIVTGELENTTDSPIRGVAVRVEFLSPASGETSVFYGWAGGNLDPIEIETATTLATLAELARRPVAVTIAPAEAIPFVVLAPGAPMDSVARVTASPLSAALPLPADGFPGPVVAAPVDVKTPAKVPARGRGARARANAKP